MTKVPYESEDYADLFDHLPPEPRYSVAWDEKGDGGRQTFLAKEDAEEFFRKKVAEDVKEFRATVLTHWDEQGRLHVLKEWFSSNKPLRPQREFKQEYPAAVEEAFQQLPAPESTRGESISVNGRSLGEYLKSIASPAPLTEVTCYQCGAPRLKGLMCAPCNL